MAFVYCLLSAVQMYEYRSIRVNKLMGLEYKFSGVISLCTCMYVVNAVLHDLCKDMV